MTATTATTPTTTDNLTGADATLQWINVGAFVFCLILNGIYSSKPDLRNFNINYDLVIHPHNKAFAIWGIIYTMLIVFVVYQVLPASVVPSRNDQLIFGDIGYWFAANMVLNAVWLVIFTRDTKSSIIVSFINIVLLWVTGLVILFKSTACEVNLMEGIFLRGTFSIYMGWVTAATALNYGFMRKIIMLGNQSNDDYMKANEKEEENEIIGGQ